MNEKGEPYFIGVGNSEEQSLVTSEPATDLPEDFDLNGEDVQLQEESSVVINMEDDTTEVISNISNYVVYIEDNEIKTCGLQVTDESGFIIPTCVEILPNQVFAVAGNLTGQKCFDLSTGQEIKSYSKEDGNIARINNKLCTINLMDNQIDVYDEKADEIERSILCDGMDEIGRANV